MANQMKSSSGGASNNVRANFPFRLHYLLSQATQLGVDDISSWHPSGEKFIIYNQAKFVSTILPNIFKQTKFSSFRRQLNAYGFEREINKNSPKNKKNLGTPSKFLVYSHKEFRRDDPVRSGRMPRRRTNQILLEGLSRIGADKSFIEVLQTVNKQGKAHHRHTYQQQEEQLNMAIVNLPVDLVPFKINSESSTSSKMANEGDATRGKLLQKNTGTLLQKVQQETESIMAADSLVQIPSSNKRIIQHDLSSTETNKNTVTPEEVQSCEWAIQQTSLQLSKLNSIAMTQIDARRKSRIASYLCQLANNTKQEPKSMMRPLSATSYSTHVSDDKDDDKMTDTVLDELAEATADINMTEPECCTIDMILWDPRQECLGIQKSVSSRAA